MASIPVAAVMILKSLSMTISIPDMILLVSPMRLERLWEAHMLNRVMRS